MNAKLEKVLSKLRKLRQHRENDSRGSTQDETDRPDQEEGQKQDHEIPILQDIDFAEDLVCEALEAFLSNLSKSEKTTERRKEELCNQCEQLIQIQQERARNKRTLAVLDDEISKTKDMIGQLTQIKKTELEQRVKITEPILFSEYLTISSSQGAKDFLTQLKEKQRNLDDLRKLAVMRLSRFSKLTAKRKDKPQSKINGSAKKIGTKQMFKRSNESAQTSSDDRATRSAAQDLIDLCNIPLALDIFEPRPQVPILPLTSQLRNGPLMQSPTLYFRDPMAEAMVNGLNLTDIDPTPTRQSRASSTDTDVDWNALVGFENLNLDTDSLSNPLPSQASRSRSSLSIDEGFSSSMPETDV